MNIATLRVPALLVAAIFVSAAPTTVIAAEPRLPTSADTLRARDSASVKLSDPI